jgi:hypothetical protein
VEPQKIDLLIGAAKAVSGGTSNLTIALISAGAAIVGAVVGGGLTAYATYRIERSRQTHDFELEDKRHAHEDALAAQAAQREVEREHRALLGTSRMLVSYLAQVQSTLNASLKQGVWWPRIAAFDPPPSDIERVLSLLTNEEWLLLASARTMIEGLEILRRVVDLGEGDERSVGEPRIELTESDKKTFHDALERIAKARTALVRVASGLTPSDGQV